MWGTCSVPLGVGLSPGIDENCGLAVILQLNKFQALFEYPGRFLQGQCNYGSTCPSYVSHSNPKVIGSGFVWRHVFDTGMLRVCILCYVYMLLPVY